MPPKKIPSISSKVTVNPFKNKNVGRRTGKDIKAGKVIRKTAGGFENFDDYWSESEADVTRDGTFIKPPAAEAQVIVALPPQPQPALKAQHPEVMAAPPPQPAVLAQSQIGNLGVVRNAVNPFLSKQIGPRTGRDIKAGKVIRKTAGGFENFDDYWSESDADSIISSFSRVSGARSSSGLAAGSAVDRRSVVSNNGGSVADRESLSHQGKPTDSDDIIKGQGQTEHKVQSSTSENVDRARSLGSAGTSFTSKEGFSHETSGVRSRSSTGVASRSEGRHTAVEVTGMVSSQSQVINSESDVEIESAESTDDSPNEAESQGTSGENADVESGAATAGESAKEMESQDTAAESDAEVRSRRSKAGRVQEVCTQDKSGSESAGEVGETTSEEACDVESQDSVGENYPEMVRESVSGKRSQESGAGVDRTEGGRRQSKAKRVSGGAEGGQGRRSKALDNTGSVQGGAVTGDEDPEQDEGLSGSSHSGDRTLKASSLKENPRSSAKQTDTSLASQPLSAKRSKVLASGRTDTTAVADNAVRELTATAGRRGKSSSQGDSTEDSSQGTDEPDDDTVTEGARPASPTIKGHDSGGKSLKRESRVVQSAHGEVVPPVVAQQAKTSKRAESTTGHSQSQHQVVTIASPLATSQASASLSYGGDVTGSISINKTTLSPKARLFGARKRLAYDDSPDKGPTAESMMKKSRSVRPQPQARGSKAVVRSTASRIPEDLPEVKQTAPSQQDQQWTAPLRPGTLPPGTLPPGTLPPGTLPSGTLPPGTLPPGTLPPGTLPPGTLPPGTLPLGTQEPSCPSLANTDISVSRTTIAGSGRFVSLAGRRGAQSASRSTHTFVSDSEDDEFDILDESRSYRGNAKRSKVKATASRAGSSLREASQAQGKDGGETGAEGKAKRGRSKKQAEGSFASSHHGQKETSSREDTSAQPASTSEAEPGASSVPASRPRAKKARGKTPQKGSTVSSDTADTVTAQGRKGKGSPKSAHSVNGPRKQGSSMQAAVDTGQGSSPSPQVTHTDTQHGHSEGEDACSDGGDAVLTDGAVSQPTHAGGDRLQTEEHPGKKLTLKKTRAKKKAGRTDHDVGTETVKPKRQQRKRTANTEQPQSVERVGRPQSLGATQQKSHASDPSSGPKKQKMQRGVDDVVNLDNWESAGGGRAGEAGGKGSDADVTLVVASPAGRPGKRKSAVSAEEAGAPESQQKDKPAKQGKRRTLFNSFNMFTDSSPVHVTEVEVHSRAFPDQASPRPGRKSAVAGSPAGRGKQPKAARQGKQQNSMRPLDVPDIEEDSTATPSKGRPGVKGSKAKAAVVSPQRREKMAETGNRVSKAKAPVVSPQRRETPSGRRSSAGQGASGQAGGRQRGRKKSTSAQDLGLEAGDHPQDMEQDMDMGQDVVDDMHTPTVDESVIADVIDSALKSGISFRRISHAPSSLKVRRSRQLMQGSSMYDDDIISTPPLENPRRQTVRETPVLKAATPRRVLETPSFIQRVQGGKKGKNQRRVTISDDVTHFECSPDERRVGEETTTALPSMSATPVHYQQTATPAPSPPRRPWDKTKLVPPEEEMSGLRRSKRTRVRRLEWYKNERIIYDRRQSGPVIMAVQPSMEQVYQEHENRRRMKHKIKTLAKKKQRSKKASSGRRLSTHVALSPDLNVTDSKEIPIMHEGREMLMCCFNRISDGSSIGPRGDTPRKDDPFSLRLMTQQKLFTTGILTLAPACKKPLQRAVSTAVSFSITFGKVLISVNRAKTILETGDHFFVPKGTVYSLKNLREEEAVLSFVNLMLD